MFGERGSLRLSCYHADSLDVWATGGPTKGAWRRIRPLIARAAKLPAAMNAARQGGDSLASYFHQWKCILEALRAGGPMPASVDDGRAAARIVLAALRSSQEGSVVPVGGSVSDRLPEGVGK